MTALDTRKAQLSKRLTDLNGRLAGIETELEGHTNPDWEELATLREGDEVLDGIGLSGQHEIRMIEAALKRIEDGEYGFCARCGTAIAAERLDAVPFTPFCQSCAAAQEKHA